MSARPESEIFIGLFSLQIEERTIARLDCGMVLHRYAQFSEAAVSATTVCADIPLNDLPHCKLCKSPTRLWHDLGKYRLVQCKDCGFRFLPYLDDERAAAERPTPDDLEKHRKYAEAALEYSVPRLKKMLDLVLPRVPRGGIIIDVGCGAGHFLKALGTNYQTLGIEISPVWYAISKERQVDAYPYPLGHPFWDNYRGKADAVTLWDAIEHVNDPVSVCSYAYNLLAPGGALIMDTPSANGLLYKLGEMTTRLSKGRRPTTLGIQYSPTPFDHKQIFRKSDMRHLLELAGFRHSEIHSISQLSLPLDFYLEKMHIHSALWNLARIAVRIVPLLNKMIVIATKPN